MTDLEPTAQNRRSFIRQSSAALAGAAVLPGTAAAAARTSRALGNQTIRIALIGCGGRGTGAAIQALSTEGEVQLVAMADAFRDRLDNSFNEISNARGERVAVPEGRKYVGFDAYRQVIDSDDVDLVILTTPPGFRPMHYEYAVQNDKHVFMEKPVAVDGPGIRRVLAATEVAKQKDLKVGVGLQRHHDVRYQETVQRIQDGAIGDIVMLRAYWNSGGVWVRPRQTGMTEMEYQMRNWYYFNWLCGDHIVEQHIHNLDVCNWVMNDYPVEANGMGGRQVRTGIDHGEIFDHHMIEYTYANGAKMISQCRHQPRAWSSVSEHAHGTAGSANISGHRIEGSGGWDWRYRGDSANPYQVEHDVLFAKLRAGEHHNEGEYGAKSTMTAILGRMATYCGKKVRWDDAINSEIALVPSAYTWDANPPSLPDGDGRYPIPTPGVTTAL